MSGLQLPGSLAVSVQPLAAVGLSLDTTVKYAIEALERTKNDGSASFTNFIEAELDLNSRISYVASATGKDADDAYALKSIEVSKSDAKNALYSLPSASGVSVDAGEVDAQDPLYASLGKFPVTLTVSCDANGLMTSAIALSGQDVAATAADEPNQAQKAYWSGPQTTPDVAADDADLLNTKLTSAQLSTFYASELLAINNQYNNVEMVKNWTISVAEIGSSTNNVLAQHARFLGKKGNTIVFSAGQKMVASVPFSYGVSIDDYLGNATTIVNAANVFGVLSQSAEEEEPLEQRSLPVAEEAGLPDIAVGAEAPN